MGVKPAMILNMTDMIFIIFHPAMSEKSNPQSQRLSAVA
jgi:hypothetical protein